MTSESTTFDPAASARSECDREPIHIPGSIQPHGMLLALDARHRVIQASRNAPEFLERPLGRILDEAIQDVLGQPATETLAPMFEPFLEDCQPRYLGVVPVDLPGRSALFGLIAHRYRGVLILELEPLIAERPAGIENIYPLSNTFIARVQQTRTLDELTRMASIELRRLTGFDRVLIYRFEADWSGTVIAEDRNDVFPSLMDHRFPATDIPMPARELYRHNRLRLIADADYAPVPIVPADRPDTGRPLDLTYSALRSVSPIHIEYMKNMGTIASMSISILREGQLWGLISCHHGEPKVVPFATRTACDLLGQVFSLQLEAREHHAEFERRIELKSIQVNLLAHMAAEEDYRDGLARDPATLLSLASARGAAIVAEDRCELIGETPSEIEVRRLVAWLSATGEKEVYETSSISSVFPEAAAYSDRASGLLAVSISKLHPSYILWFRPEVTRTIKWAGDPTRAPAYDSGKKQISPRKSFQLWQETVRHKAIPFRPSEIEAAVEFRNAVIGIVLRNAEEMAELSEELERSNKELEAFSYSVSHDLRAPFRHIAGYSELLRESAGTRLNDGERRYLDVIIGSAQQAGTLVDSLLAFSRMGRQKLNYQAIDMNELFRETIQEVSLGLDAGRKIEWRMADLPVVSGDMIMLRQVARNLLSNAVKFTETQPETVIEVGSSSGETETIFFVKDNGVGFDMEYVGKLFGVFQRLHRVEEFEGTGIGLANVRRIVGRHGGRTWAEGELGVGATFFFSLPKRPTDLESRL